MPTATNTVTIANIFRNRRGSITYRFIIAVFGVALKIFFRRIETVNADSVPRGTGVIFVMNHPNGLIDPALVFVAMPRRISFLAKSTIFKMPVLGWILRTVGALPLYRRIDAGEDVSKNQETFGLCRELLRGGGSIALFPEGVSHNSPKLLPLKSGASRIALGAASMNDGDVDVKIVPVGLYYTNKTTFRSEVMLHFGESFDVSQTVLDEHGHPPRESVNALTEQIDAALRGVTLNAESEAELHTARIAEEMLASAQREQSLGSEFEFQKDFIKETNDEINAEADEKLKSKLREFDAHLNAFGIEAEHLSLAQYSRRSVLRGAVRYAWKLILLAPFALIGAILHFPAYKLCGWISHRYSKDNAEDMASTVKVLAGIVFMPLTWVIAAGITYYFWRSPWAMIAIPVSLLLGYAALYISEEFEEARGWAKAIWLFFKERDKFLRLFIERREIQKELRNI